MLHPILDRQQLISEITNCINSSLDLKEVLSVIVEKIRLFLSIDRVKIYQFANDDTGEVVAESVDTEHLPSLLGLHFPANDIPPHARLRFAKGRQRVIVDVAAKWKTFHSIDSTEVGQSEFNNHSQYAPVDPCHIQYLLAMGVLSSMSIPIFYQNQLWGLLVAHHSQPRHFSEPELQTVQLLTNQLSIAIAQATLISQAKQQAEQEAFIYQINDLLENPGNQAEIWPTILKETVQALQGDGGRLYIVPKNMGEQVQIYTFGKQPVGLQPEESSIWQKAIWLTPRLANGLTSNLNQTVSKSEEFDRVSHHREGLPHIYTIADFASQPDLENIAKAFSAASMHSILLIPLRYRNQGVGCLSIFRQERQIETLWAGRSNTDSRNQIPRQSFNAWCEIKRQTPDWSKNHLKLAQRLGVHLYIAITQNWVERMISHHASHDVLTNLPNWKLFNQQLALSVINARQQGKILAVAILNLARFKTINQTFGHATGDYLLQLVVSRLQSTLQTYQNQQIAHNKNILPPVLARWHGDKFTILLPEIETIQELTSICQQILQVFKIPFSLQGQEIYLTATLGIAIAPYDGEMADVLLQHAETALYQAKKQGKNSYHFYSRSINNRDLEHLMLEVDLHKALARDEFVIYYQPQVELATKKVVGMEALIRWQHPGLGLVNPQRFIPLAEETGLINGIGEWVLRTACLQHRAWRMAGCSPVKICVNISARQFQQDDLADKIIQIFQDTQMEPHYLELEITESTAMYDPKRTIAMLQRLKKLGVQIAIDDFGTGHSAMSYLKMFPIDTLKIDKSFVQDVVNNPHDAAIVKAIVALGKGLHLKVVGEGIENEEQWDFLNSIECNEAQGYLISIPLPSTQAIVYLLCNPNGNNTDKKNQNYLEISPLQNIHHSVSMSATSLEDVQTTLLPLNVTNDHHENSPIFNVTQQELLQKILEYENLKEELKQQAKKEKLVTEIAQKIRQSLNISDILNTTANEIRHFLQADRVILYRFAPDWSGEVVVESVGVGCPSILGEKIDDPCFRKHYVKSYSQGRIKAIEDVSNANLSECYFNMLTKYEIKANLVVPVTYQEQMWGLLIAHQCRHPRQWRQSDINFLTQLATQAAIAIHQGELYTQLETANRELQELSARDGLTGVANRHRFDRYLAQQWNLLLEKQSFLSLILCDVDHFKLYNDTYGHQAGDACLQQVARAISSVIQRPADLVARYGGEEFAVILPNTLLKEAWEIAEQIRLQVKDLSIFHSQSPDRCVTLSLGVAAVIPHSNSSLTALIAAADTALYQAKKSGRNRTSLLDG
ncbi:MAG TPA: diguanylate cyclase [Leptolyngbyaceae cyanobacterium]